MRRSSAWSRRPKISRNRTARTGARASVWVVFGGRGRDSDEGGVVMEARRRTVGVRGKDDGEVGGGGGGMALSQ